jgi:putative transposase
MQRNLNFSIDEFYHIYNRGNEKQKIFKDKTDYRRFIILLYYANSVEPVHLQTVSKEIKKLQGGTLKKMDERGETLVDIGAWCLMPNHFHLLIKEKVDGGISKFLSKLTTGYTMYFNKRYERVGSLLQGTFKAEHLDKDTYLKYLFSYIHLNPIKLFQSNWKEVGICDNKKALDFLKLYEHSSYLDYLSNNRGYSFILNKEAFPKYFENKKDFNQEIFDWLTLLDNQ